MTCKDCLHYEACKSMLEALGYTVNGDGVEADERCDQFEKADKWISVKDQLPKVFQSVIVCRKKSDGSTVVEPGMKELRENEWKVYGTRCKSVTHWMPLPAPPKED